MAWMAKVVFPDDSGPYISTTLPRGYPPTPRAISMPRDPVEMASTFSTTSSPSFITAPLPYDFSIRSMVICRALSFSLFTSVAMFISVLERFHHLLRRLLGFHFFDYFFDDPVFIDYVGDAEDSVEFPPHEFLFPPSTVLVDHLLVGIGDERKGQIVFCDEFAVGRFGIGADAYHLKPFVDQ